MSRFKDYIKEVTLDEKVSQKEIKEALKNDNILMGAEYEMWVPGATGGHIYNEFSDRFDNAYKEWRQWLEDVDTYEKESSEYYDETRKLEDTRESIQDAVDGAMPYTDEDDDSYDFQSEWIDKKYSDEWIRDYNMDKINKSMGIKGELSLKDVDTIEKLSSLIEDMEQEVSDLDERITYREDEGLYEEVEMPYLLAYDYSDYVEYMNDMYYEMGYGENITDEVSNGKYMPGDGDEPPQPIDIDDIDDSNDGNWDDNAVEDSLSIDDAPFSNWEAGGYGSVTQVPGSDLWAIEDDPSISGNGEGKGVEIKSPPTPLPEAMDDLKDMLDWMNGNGYKTNSSTGLHIHMSMKNPSKDFDPLKLLLFTDQGYIFNKFPDRLENSYVVDVHKKFKTSGTLKSSDRKKLFDEKKIIIDLFSSSSHYDAININSIKDNHVEFRYMGSNYSNKYKDISAVIGNYAHNMALAADPKYKKKEYHHKLERIFNKMELFSLIKKIFFFKGTIQGLKSVDSVKYKSVIQLFNIHLRKLINNKKMLERNYKISKSEYTDISRNHGYTKGIISEYDNERFILLKSKGFNNNEIKGIIKDGFYNGNGINEY